jgi:ubiquinone/menaquinone biosynthesis C-methylase UbiE
LTTPQDGGLVHSSDAAMLGAPLRSFEVSTTRSKPMIRQTPNHAFSGNPAENYQRYFVPLIGAPLARDLVDAAALCAGERVLDVTCGTGVVTRLAAERVGTTGAAAGGDVHAGMLAVARSVSDAAIDWYETDAQAMPLPDERFDVALCQMGLQFVPDKLAALREMRRVLVPGGRVLVNVPGPTPRMFSILADALAKHVDAKAGAFVRAVFSLHDEGKLEALMNGSGLREPVADAATRTLRLPEPKQFLWQYIYSTPLAERLASVDDKCRAAVEEQVCGQWRAFVADGAMTLELGVTTVRATRQ